MIAGLDRLLEDACQPGLGELRAALRELLDGSEIAGRVAGVQRLSESGSIARVQLELNQGPASVVVKRSRPAAAQRNRLIAQRCLPAVGLHGGAPALLATAAERSGRHVWQVYEDLGESTLAGDRDSAGVEAAVRLLGGVHASFTGHPRLAEAREWGADLGTGFYGSSVRDAISCLQALSPRLAGGGCDWSSLRDRLLERMWALMADEHERTRAIAELGGPETLLHGDMWLKNACVTFENGRIRAALIDWDQAGVGPCSYDLSTFVNGFTPAERHRVLELYEHAVADTGWPLPGDAELMYLFRSFELARIANCVAWSALAANDHVDESLEELAYHERWLESIDEFALTP